MADAPPGALLTILKGAERVLLSGPEAPDGDSLGACLALRRVLLARGVRVDVAGSPAQRYHWLPGISELYDDPQLAQHHYDAVVVLDGDRHRLTPAVEHAFQAARVHAIVDHHATTKPDGYEVFWVQPAAASTCEMLYHALDGWSVPLDAVLATLLYVGVVFDTGGFRYSNTTPSTHQMAAALIATGIDHARICTRLLMERSPRGLQATGALFAGSELHAEGRVHTAIADASFLADRGLVDGDLAGVVDGLVHTAGVMVAALLIARGDGSFKVSLRSQGPVDVSRVAHSLAPSGGGHAKAAGVCLVGGARAVQAQVVAAITRALPTGDQSSVQFVNSEK